MTDEPTDDEMAPLTACIDLLARTGATSVQVRYSDDEQPTVWTVVAVYGDRWEVAAGRTPIEAAGRCCERIVDGGTCTHCRRPTAFESDFGAALPLEDAFCWYVYDPELRTVRRGCEGATP